MYNALFGKSELSSITITKWFMIKFVVKDKTNSFFTFSNTTSRELFGNIQV